MSQIGRPTGLIGYDTDINVQRRIEGKPAIYRPIRPRTIIYAGFIAIVGSIMIYTLATRGTMSVNVLHERNPLFVQLSDGGVRNDYTVRLLNKRAARDFILDVTGLPNAIVRVSGAARSADGHMIINVGQDQTREIRMQVEAASSDIPPAPTDIEIRITDPVTGTSASTHDHFIPPTR
jgi:polyferredoxin